MRKFTIVPKRNVHSEEVAEKLKENLIEKGLIEDAAEPEVVIVVGGDGSMLFAVQEYLDMLDRVAFVGVNTGTLGFFMDYTEAEIETLAGDLARGEGEIREFPMLEVMAGGEKLYAVNEVRLENPVRTQDVAVYFNGEKFEDLRSSGLCIATQLGSTAYNRSLGGAILQEGLGALVFTEIAGIHHPKYKSIGAPFVMNDEVEVSLKSEDFEGAYLGADSSGVQLNGGGEVIVKKSAEKRLKMLRMREISHFERLGRLL